MKLIKTLVETQRNISVVLITDVSNGADVILGKPEIQSLKDLKGRRVGAFKQGTVDAVVTFEPVRSNLLKSGAKLLFDSTQIPGEIEGLRIPDIQESKKVVVKTDTSLLNAVRRLSEVMKENKGRQRH